MIKNEERLEFMKLLKSSIMSLLAVAVMCTVFCFPAAADTSIAIDSIDDLKNMESNPTANYYLTKDIVFDKSDEEFQPLFSATNQFKGILDGKGYAIRGINIASVKSTTGSSSYSGIFAYNSGTIKNLNVENATAQSLENKYAYTGIIAAVNMGTIENCYVSGKSQNKNIDITAYTGGICGQMLKGEIINSVSYANVYSSGGEQYTGGISGYSEKGILKKCAAYGSIFINGIDTTMDGYGGGIVGFSRVGTEFTNCLFGGGVIVEKTSNSYIGGVSGLTYGKVNCFVSYGTLTPSEVISHIYIGCVAGEDSSADVENTYYLDGTINEEITGRNGKALSKDEFLDQSKYVDFDFGKTWAISDGVIKLIGLPEPSPEDVVSELKGIKIESLPKKLKYVQGDPALDLTGLKVSAVYTDKTVALMQNEYTVGGYNYVIDGEQAITISYKGFTESFKITVAKTTESIILPSGNAQGSYQEGNSTGKVPDKKPTSSKDNSDKSESTSSKLNTSVVIGGNTVEDTLTDDETDESKNSNTTSDQNSSDASGSDGKIEGDKPNQNEDAGNTIGAIDAPVTSSEPDGPTVLSPLIIVVLIIIGIVGIAAIVIWFILKSKSQTPANEVSNEELEEVETDENDVYNK